MPVKAGLEVMFVGEARRGAVKNQYPDRSLVPTNTQGVVVEDTGKGVLCDFRVKGQSIRMYAPRWELRKIKRKVS